MKKIIVCLLSLVLVCSLLVGCGTEQTAKERLDEAVLNSQDMKTVKEKIDASIGIELDEEQMTDPGTAMMLSMLKDIKFTAEMQADNENMSFDGTVKVDLQGMSYESEIFFSPEKYVVKVPIVGKYLVLYDLTEDSEENEEFKQIFENVDQLKELSKDLTSDMLGLFNEDDIVAGEETTVSLPSGDVKATPLEISLNDAELKDFMKKALIKLLENDSMREYIASNLKMQNEMLGEEFNEEEFIADIDEAKSEIEENFDEINDILTFDNLKLVYYLDKKNNIVKNDFDIKLTIKEAMEEGAEEDSVPAEFSIIFTGTADIWDINKPVEITMPELTEENSMTMEEMMGGSMEEPMY